MEVGERIRIEELYYYFTYKYISSLYSYTTKLQLASTVEIYKNNSNRKVKTIKIKLKLPGEPFKNLFEEIDIQKNCFDKWNRDIRSHDPLKKTREGVHCNTARSRKIEHKVKLKSFNQKLFPNKIVVAYWEVLTENTCFEITRW